MMWSTGGLCTCIAHPRIRIRRFSRTRQPPARPPVPHIARLLCRCPHPVKAKVRALARSRSYLFELLFEGGDVIDAEKVREVAYTGIPGRTGLRSIVWKLLLG